VRKEKRLLWGSILCFFLMSAAILLMPLGSRGRGWSIFSGAVFWLFLLLGIAAQCALASALKRRERSAPERPHPVRQRPGLLCVFRNPLAAAADAVFALSLIALIVTLVWITKTAYVCFVLLAAVAFTFCLHCILNGRSFARVCRASERERTQKSTRGSLE